MLFSLANTDIMQHLSKINSTYSSSSCCRCRPRRSQILEDFVDVRQSCIISVFFADVAHQSEVIQISWRHLPVRTDQAARYSIAGAAVAIILQRGRGLRT